MCKNGYIGDACQNSTRSSTAKTVVTTRTSNDCQHNCSGQGRCSALGSCICKDGFSGTDCSQVCPNRCTGHGICRTAVCICRNGYHGNDCAWFAHQSVSQGALRRVESHRQMRSALSLVAMCVALVMLDDGHPRFFAPQQSQSWQVHLRATTLCS